MNSEARVVAGVLVLLACLQVSDLLQSAPKDAAAPQQTEVEPQQSEGEPLQAAVGSRETLRPQGNFRELVYEHIAHLQAAVTEEDGCRAAHQLGNLFHSIDDAERQAIEEEMLAQMIALLDQDTLHGSQKCISHVLGGIFWRIGARAEAAVPALERALKSAELARSARVATQAECEGFRFSPDRQLDYVLRQALVEIDGRARSEGDTLKCPQDGDPSD